MLTMHVIGTWVYVYWQPCAPLLLERSDLDGKMAKVAVASKGSKILGYF